jgi:hypothetical protein
MELDTVKNLQLFSKTGKKGREMNNSQFANAKSKVPAILFITAFAGLLCLPAVCLASPCLAYVGPGSGVTMLWALLAVLAGILFMVLGLVLWPLRMLIRAIKRNKSKNKTQVSPNLNTASASSTDNDKQTIPSPEHS